MHMRMHDEGSSTFCGATLVAGAHPDHQSAVREHAVLYDGGELERRGIRHGLLGEGERNYCASKRALCAYDLPKVWFMSRSGPSRTSDHGTTHEPR